MLKFILLTVLAAVALTECVNAKEAEVRYIRDIKEGPYQNYSGRALVQLGDGWYFFETTFQANWYEASNFCRNLGMFLVSVETQEENDLIKDHIWNVAGIGHYWMSGNDLATGEWVWESTGQKVIFTDWHVGEPTYGSLVENYMHYFYFRNELLWNNINNVDNYKGEPIYPICEDLQ